MTMGTKEALQKVRSVLEAGWAQNAMATNANGRPVSALSEEATCFCMYGAIEKVCMADPIDNHVHSALVAAIYRFSGSMTGVVLFNDHYRRTKEEVLSVVDSAIAEAA